MKKENCKLKPCFNRDIEDIKNEEWIDILEYNGIYPENELPTIGSFGFGGWHKGFHDISRHVSRSYSKAIINILMPYAYFGDKDGIETRKIAEYCHALNTYHDIKINI